MELPKENKYDLAHTGTKAVLNLIPIVGGTITEIFNALVTPPIEKRKREWMESVVQALEVIERKQEGIIQKLSEDEEFASLLISASINAYKTHLAEKHKILKNAVINSINTDISYDIKQIFINFIDELTIPHLTVLKFINDFEDKITSVDSFEKIYNILIKTGTIDQNVPRMQMMEITAFRFILKDLEAKGLTFISDDMTDLEGHVYEKSFMLVKNGDDETELPYIKITDFGKSLLLFIHNE